MPAKTVATVLRSPSPHRQGPHAGRHLPQRFPASRYAVSGDTAGQHSCQSEASCGLPLARWRRRVSAERPQDRSEDYITKDLIRNVESRFPAASGRENRAIIGVSMGGFGAVVLALKHPDLFAFAGGMSSALDVPTRRFSLRRVAQYRAHAQIFGPWGSETRITSNPYHLAESVDPAKTPICISLAESKKACFRRMRDSQPCSEIMGSNTNSILALEVTIGISGTADSPD
jgi:Putative esterase